MPFQLIIFISLSKIHKAFSLYSRQQHAEQISWSHNSGLGARRPPQVETEGASPPRPEGGEPGTPVRRGGPDGQEVRRRLQQEILRRGTGRQPEEAGRGDGAGGYGPGGAGGKAGDPEGAAGEEDEPGRSGQADQRAASGGPGVRKRQGRAEPGRSGEDGEGSWRQAQGKDREMRAFQRRRLIRFVPLK